VAVLKAVFPDLRTAQRAEEELFIFGLPRDHISITRVEDGHAEPCATTLRAGQVDGGFLDDIADVLMPAPEHDGEHTLTVDLDPPDEPACRSIIEDHGGRVEWPAATAA
jgi:hypothetical protein